MMDSRSSAGPLVQRLADIPAVVMALGVLGLLVRTVSKRIAYPYDLEWMEGGMLAHAARVADGQSLYVSPSLDFIPFIYPPLYPWVVGGLSALGFPLDYPLGRAVSLLSVALAAVALYCEAAIPSSAELSSSSFRGPSSFTPGVTTSFPLHTPMS